jgi:hypothetical protein
VTLTVEMLRKAKAILQEADDEDNARLDRHREHFKATGKCIEHRWATVFDGNLFAMSSFCVICDKPLP